MSDRAVQELLPLGGETDSPAEAVEAMAIPLDDERDDLWVDRHRAVAEASEDALDQMGEVGDRPEAKAAGDALYGMRGAEDRVDDLRIRVTRLEREQSALHGRDVLGGLVEEELAKTIDIV